MFADAAQVFKHGARGFAACMSAPSALMVGAPTRHMSEPLRILFTNNTLARPAGTEMSTHDACLAMRARGHTVAVFSREHGEVAEKLRAQGVTVLLDPADAPFTPDVIHGHHEWETTLAALAWPRADVVSFCRGPDLWQEAPCRAPNVAHWAAVDEPCRERLIKREGISADLVRLLQNGVDLARFPARASPLPAKPARALVFSNYASDDNYLPAIRSACEAEGIALEVIGAAAGKPCAAPEHELPRFDVVFAKGKAALEALASGCGVIVCDSAGIGPMVTTANFESLRQQSFGNPCMTDAIEHERVRERLRAFDAAESTATSQMMRDTCGLDAAMDRIEAAYREALSFPKQPPDAETWTRFIATLLNRTTSAYKLGRKIQEAWHEHRKESDPIEMSAETMHRIINEWRHADEKLGKEQARNARLRQELDDLKVATRSMKEELAKAKRGWLARLFGKR